MEEKEVNLEKLVNCPIEELPEFVSHRNLIYCCRNLINNKVYIGETKRTLRERWEEHKYIFDGSCKREINMAIHSAIKKYGIENFSISILEEGLDDTKERKKREQFWIEKFNSFVDNPYSNGYNMTTGGDSGSKISEEKTKRGLDTRVKKYGKAFHLTEESKRKAIETNKKNHGGILAFQAEKYREKGRKTQIEKYGMLAVHLPENKEKAKRAMREKYGDVLPYNTKEAIEKAQKSAPLHRMIGCIKRHINILEEKQLEINAKNYVLETNDVKHMWQQHVPHVLKKLDELRKIEKWNNNMETIFSNIIYDETKKGINKIIFKDEN